MLAQKLEGANELARELAEYIMTEVNRLSALVTQFQHVEWAGLRLWDLIQPSFMFLVGVSVAFSYASRARRG